MSTDNNQVLPLNVDRQDFDKALVAFRKLLGEENVLIENDKLTPYRKIMMSVEDAEYAQST